MSAFKAVIILLVGSLCAHAAAAETTAIWATDKACPAMKPAAIEIARVPFPSGWTIVVACNDVQWSGLQGKGDARDTQHAFTNLQGKITVVRGAIFLQLIGGRSAHRVLLHEIGHIRCRCPDEWKAESWAAQYEHSEGSPRQSEIEKPLKPGR